MKKCPFCAEDIQDAAIKCRYCGSNLGASVVASAAKTPQSAPSGKRYGRLAALTLIGGIVGAIVIAIIDYRTDGGASRVLDAPSTLITRGAAPLQQSQPAIPATIPPQQRQPAAVPTPTSWKLVNDWHGSGIKQTETFTVRSREWPDGLTLSV